MDHTFVVPAYGCSPFLRACLESLRRQKSQSPIVITTSTPSEFIEKVAAEYHVPILVNPAGGSIAKDWNFALEATSARFATLAHQDDIYGPEYSERILMALSEGSGSLCFTGYEEIDDNGRIVSSKISYVKHFLAAITLGKQNRPSPRRLRYFLAFGNPLPCSSVTFDRHRLAGFCFSSEFASNLDWDAWLRLVDRGEIFVHVPARLVGRRHNALSATASLIADGRRRSEDLTMFRRIWAYPFSDIIATVYRLSY